MTTCRKLLLIEDNPEDACLVRHHLMEDQTHSNVLAHAETLREGLSLVEDSNFDVALVNLRLPDAQGIETVKRIREADSSMPLVVLTRLNDEAAGLEAVRQGAQYYLPKEYLNQAWLQSAIQHAIERQSLQQQLTAMQNFALRTERDRVALETARAAAHEINTPLTVLMGRVELMMAGKEQSESTRHSLEAVYESAERIRDTVIRMTKTKHYARKEYAGSAQMVDFDLAGEDLLRKVFIYSNDAIFVLDPLGDRILDANPKACAMLDYSRDEMLSTPISAIHPHEIPQLQSFVRSVRSEGFGWTDQLSCRAKTGRFLSAEISAASVEIAGLSGIVAIIHYVNERHARRARPIERGVPVGQPVPT